MFLLLFYFVLALELEGYKINIETLEEETKFFNDTKDIILSKVAKFNFDEAIDSAETTILQEECNMLDGKLSDFKQIVEDRFSFIRNIMRLEEENKNLIETVAELIVGAKDERDQIIKLYELNEIRQVSPLPLIVSLAAAVTTATIKEQLGSQPTAPAIVRTMPNTPSAVGEGMTGLFADETVPASHKKLMDVLFNSIGKVLWIDDENKFHALTALSGSGPAYFFQFTNAMIQAGITQGLSEHEATVLAVQTAKGAGILMAETGKEPSQLQKEVTSKGGTTAAATNVLHEGGIDSLVNKAIAAAHERSVEMSQED